jgi:hypothetical protein
VGLGDHRPVNKGLPGVSRSSPIQKKKKKNAFWWTGGNCQSADVWMMVLLIFCGVSGGNAMIDVSRTARGHWWSLCPYFLILCILG